MRAFPSFTRAAFAVACALAWLPAAQAQAPVAGEAKPPAEVNNSTLNHPMFTQLILAELNARSGDKAYGYQLMVDAARRSKDEGLFLRAVTIAVEGGDGNAALAAVKAWREVIPGSVQAANFDLQLLARLDRFPEAAVAAQSLLDLTPPADRAVTFATLPRPFARNKDRQQTVALLEPVLKFWIDSPDTRVAATVTLARLVAVAGDSARAVDLTRTAHAHDPAAEGPALFALELMSSTPAAEAVVLGHLRARPDSVRVRTLYAQVLSAMQRYDDAAAELKYVTSTAPQAAPPWLTLAALQLELKRPAEANATLNRYLAGLKDGSIVPVAATPAAATDDDDDGEADDAPRDTSLAPAYYLLAKAAEQQRDYPAAEAWLAKVTDPQNALDVAARRAELLAAQGKLKQAVDVIRKAPETRAGADRTKVVLEAQLYNDAKQWAQAEAVYAAGNKRFPNDAEMLYQQAMAAEKLNRVEQMERLLRRVIEVRPDHHHAYNALGYSLAERNLRLPEARALIVKALELAPGEPFITDSLGWVEYRLGKIPESLRLLRQAYAARQDVEIGVHLGEVLWVSGERDEARRVLRAAQQRDKDNDVLKATLLRLKVDL